MKLRGIRLSLGVALATLLAFPAFGQHLSQKQALTNLAPQVAQKISPEAKERIQATLDKIYGEKVSEKAVDIKVASSLQSLTQDHVEVFSAFETAPNGDLKIEVVLDKVSFKTLNALQQLGLDITAVDRQRGLVVASCPVEGLHESLDQIAAQSFVKEVRSIAPGRTFHGSVLSEGDAALNADQARADFGVDGTGVSVCVVSDGIENAAQAALTGDLPTDGTGSPAVEVCPLNNNSGDEGTAMLEIIHDLAPGATLGFCPAFGNGETGLANAINWLANDAFGGQGCDIIADDVALLTEPYFQDGVVAQAIDAAAANGVGYFNAAGNSAEEHYQQWYDDVNPFDDSTLGDNLHNFGWLGDPDTDWAGIVGGSGTVVSVFLQWEEPFGGAGLDFDLLLFDADGRLVGDPNGQFPVGFNGLNLQNGDDNPFERAAFRNDAGDGQNPLTGLRTFFIVIIGPGDDTVSGLIDIELHFNSNNGVFTVQAPEDYTNPEDSIYGGAAAEGSITIAATGAVVNQGGVPNPNLDIIQPFSSQGPVIIKFAPNGDWDLDIRRKPNLTAVDGVSVTGAGGFPSTFFGTSAAAPHAAAIAALVQEAANGVLDRRGLLEILEDSARSRGDDEIWGAGLIDAHEAVREALEVD